VTRNARGRLEAARAAGGWADGRFVFSFVELRSSIDP
jgi:hypothetical protein